MPRYISSVQGQMTNEEGGISIEYVESDIKTLFSDVLRYVPELKKIINNVKDYSHKHLSST